MMAGKVFWASLVLTTALAAPAAAAPRVIDGDTLELRGEHIRLNGIDAPERAQTCTVAGTEWSCGEVAKDWLMWFLAGKQVTCEGHARDRYGRLLAVCYADGENVNARLVREGWALDYRRYSKDFLTEEGIAKREGSGIWRGEFIAPWEWRKRAAKGPVASQED